MKNQFVTAIFCVVAAISAALLAAASQSAEQELPPPISDFTESEFKKLKTGRMVFRIEELEGGIFKIQAAGWIETDRRDLLYKILKHGESFKEWVPNIVASKLLESGNGYQIVEMTGKALWVIPIRSVFHRVYVSPDEVRWHLKEGPMKRDDGAWILKKARWGGTLIHYVSILEPNSWLFKRMIHDRNKEFVQKQFVAIHERLQMMEANNQLLVR